MEKSNTHFRDPIATPSILATIPDVLRRTLQENADSATKQKKSILISSNSLANRFILERWDIRPSQRRQYRDLFMNVRRHCRSVFENLLARKQMHWEIENDEYLFGVFKFDEVRGNLILGFVLITASAKWIL